MGDKLWVFNTAIYRKMYVVPVIILSSVLLHISCLFLFIIDILFTYFLSDLDISSKQVVYICFKILLERMTNQ